MLAINVLLVINHRFYAVYSIINKKRGQLSSTIIFLSTRRRIQILEATMPPFNLTRDRHSAVTLISYLQGFRNMCRASGTLFFFMLRWNFAEVSHTDSSCFLGGVTVLLFLLYCLYLPISPAATLKLRDVVTAGYWGNGGNVIPSRAHRASVIWCGLPHIESVAVLAYHKPVIKESFRYVDNTGLLNDKLKHHLVSWKAKGRLYMDTLFTFCFFILFVASIRICLFM